MRKWVLLIALLVAQGAHAGYRSGNKLLEACSGSKDPNDNLKVIKSRDCGSYIIGVSDMHDADVVWGYRPKAWCEPEGVTIGQLKQVVLEHLKDNPQNIHLNASSLVVYALAEAFPCED